VDLLASTKPPADVARPAVSAAVVAATEATMHKPYGVRYDKTKKKKVRFSTHENTMRFHADVSSSLCASTLSYLQYAARLDFRDNSPYLGAFETAYEAARHRHAAICALPEGERATYKQDFVPRPDDADGMALPPADPTAGRKRAASSKPALDADDAEMVLDATIKSPSVVQRAAPAVSALQSGESCTVRMLRIVDGVETLVVSTKPGVHPPRAPVAREYFSTR
jgi:hypothetical protein